MLNTFPPRIVVLLALVSAAQAQNYSMQTIFGKTIVTEGGNATASLLRYPIGVAADSSGNTYISDQTENRVWKVDTSGRITTYAGNGTPFYGGDNGPGSKAALKSPSGIAVDPSNNLYICDLGNNRLRKVAADGTITTVAGSGSQTFSGDGGSAKSAGILPIAVAVDKAGDLFISEGARIREIAAATGIITTIAGTGQIGYSGDNGPAVGAKLATVTALAVDAAGFVYLADYAANVIRKVDTKGMITTIGGTGTFGYSGDGSLATSANMDPYGLSLDPAGTSLYLSEPLASTIRRIDLTTGKISVFAGQAGQYGFGGDGMNAFSATFWGPLGITVDASKNLLICDTDNQRIRKVSAGTSMISTIAGTNSQSYLNHPEGINLDGKGNLYIADTGNDTAKQLNLVSDVVNSLMQFPYLPEGIAADANGNVYISSRDWFLYKLAANGQYSPVAGTGTNGYSGDNGRAASATLGRVTSVAVDAAGNVYIADDQYYRIRKIDTSGNITLIAGAGSQGATGDGGKATAAGMDPFDIALDKSGNIYVADLINHRIRKLSPGGNISTVAGTGAPGFSGDNGPATAATLNYPSGVAVDTAGNLYIADSANGLVRKVTTDGIIHTIAGDGTTYPFNGDGPALQENLSPYRLAVDATGTVYVADWANDRLRKLVPVNAASLAIVSGDKQTGNVGRPLSQSLVVRVLGSDGNPYAGASVTFAVTSGSATLSPSTSQQTANDGTASVSVTFGSTPGPVAITASSAGLTNVTFSLTATAGAIAPASLNSVSGDKQSGTIGSMLAQPLTVKVLGTDGNPYAGATVTFSVASGSATLSPSTPQQTASDGTASSSVTLGNTAGPVTVTATIAGLTPVTFSLTATPNNGPQIFAGGVVSAGLSAPSMQIASPNAILSIFGQNFAPAGTSRKVSGGDLVNGLVPTNLIGVCVTFANVRAPIFLVTPGQLNIQEPLAAILDPPSAGDGTSSSHHQLRYAGSSGLQHDLSRISGRRAGVLLFIERWQRQVSHRRH